MAFLMVESSTYVNRSKPCGSIERNSTWPLLVVVLALEVEFPFIFPQREKKKFSKEFHDMHQIKQIRGQSVKTFQTFQI